MKQFIVAQNRVLYYMEEYPLLVYLEILGANRWDLRNFIEMILINKNYKPAVKYEYII
jgi:hypothetical protein